MVECCVCVIHNFPVGGVATESKQVLKDERRSDLVPFLVHSLHTPPTVVSRRAVLPHLCDALDYFRRYAFPPCLERNHPRIKVMVVRCHVVRDFSARFPTWWLFCAWWWWWRHSVNNICGARYHKGGPWATIFIGRWLCLFRCVLVLRKLSAAAAFVTLTRDLEHASTSAYFCLLALSCVRCNTRVVMRDMKRLAYTWLVE